MNENGEYMEPSVQILLSIYKPDVDYFKKQLQSLNDQTYGSIEVLIRDDTGRRDHEIEEIVKECLTDVKYKWMKPDGKNHGFVKSFEQLIAASTASYLAFCDQDDIWDSNKIQALTTELIKTGNLAAVSDKRIIDGADHVVMESARHQNPHYYNQWCTGDDITGKDLIITFSEGMTMMVNGDFCRSILPIPDGSAHDQWALACAGIDRKVSYIDQPLVSYRRHSANVSGILKGINSKKDYYALRVMPFYKTAMEFAERYPGYDGNDNLVAFARARKDGNISVLRKLRYMAPEVVLFESAMKVCPDFLFRLLLSLVRKVG
ncbi:glycosyltransferase [Faecalibaculum rodentium]|uniref:glycosyltransferase n=3 Tax=Faecalibaculum rodentium TaxID=1702221 RepID=UPI0023F3D032|nr:glycosyltransferase [Faecalibaculum rodentium]